MSPDETSSGLVVNDGLVDLKAMVPPAPADSLLPTQPLPNEQLGRFDPREPLWKPLDGLDEIPNLFERRVQRSFLDDLDHGNSEATVDSFNRRPDSFKRLLDGWRPDFTWSANAVAVLY